jgi:hypothetical protein
MEEAFERLLKALIEAPIPTLLILAGILLLIFSVLVKVQSGTSRNKAIRIGGRSRISLSGTVIGLLLLGTGIFYPSITALSSNGTATPPSGLVAATGSNLAPISTTSTSAPAAGQAPAALGAPGLQNGCISAATWQIVSSDARLLTNTPNANGCLYLSAAGLAADNLGVLHLIRTAKDGPLAVGIYTPVNDITSIEFDLRVKTLYTADYVNAAMINFAVAPADNPLKSLDSARFKLVVDAPSKKPLVYFGLANIGETNGTKVPSQHAEYGLSYGIKLELNRLEMNVYINGVKMSKQLSVPVGDAVFLIGYSLPAQSGADIEISNLRIDGVRK